MLMHDAACRLHYCTHVNVNNLHAGTEYLVLTTFRRGCRRQQHRSGRVTLLSGQ